MYKLPTDPTGVVRWCVVGCKKRGKEEHEGAHRRYVHRSFSVLCVDFFAKRCFCREIRFLALAGWRPCPSGIKINSRRRRLQLNFGHFWGYQKSAYPVFRRENGCSSSSKKKLAQAKHWATGQIPSSCPKVLITRSTNVTN